MQKKYLFIAFALASEWALAFAFAKNFANAFANANAIYNADALRDVPRLRALDRRLRVLEAEHGREFPAAADPCRGWPGMPD